MRHIILNTLAALAATAALTACSDWDDHYEADGSDASTTLWEEITARADLSDFASVLENTMVFRQHKKTSTSYADMLKGGRSLTVMAPVNGTFNSDSLILLTATAAGDSAVERFFTMNHLSQTLNSASSATTSFRMLNDKKSTITADGVNGIGFVESNISTQNGVLHVMESQLPYKRTVYEALTQIDRFQPIGEYIASYNEDEFDADASVSSGNVDGVPVYVDSVVNERNRMLEEIGLLTSEDSTYAVVVPEAEGWEKAWEEISPYFRFPSTVEKGDSLQKYYTGNALLAHGVFCTAHQPSINDSIVSVSWTRSNWKYGVQYDPYGANGIFTRANGTEECSNGTLYYYDEWPLEPTKTFFQQVEVEAENTAYITDYTRCTYSIRSLVADSISQGSYLDVQPTTGTANWVLTYKVNNTLAGKYDVCVRVLPKTVESASGDMRPSKFRAQVNYLDEDGNAASYNNNNTTYTTDPTRVDTIVVAEALQLPTCNYDQDNTAVTVQITLNIGTRETATYNRRMYLDQIFLRPSTSNE